MSRSDCLRVRDVGAVYQLVQECRERWADAVAWREHLLSGMSRLTGLAVGIYREQELAPDCASVRFLDSADQGWRDAQARSRYLQLFTDHPSLTRFLPRCTRLARSASERGEAAALRPQIAPDSTWYGGKVFNEYFRPACIDGYVLSYGLSQHGTLIMLSACQDKSDRAPSNRARATIALLNRQITPLVGNVLATDRQLGLHGLTRRLRQTLERVLEGKSEKQIAAELCIAPTTVHDHVAALYRHFGVDGRGELTAYFLRRRPAPTASPSRQHA